MVMKLEIYFKDNIGFIKVGKTKERYLYIDYIGAYYLKKDKEQVYINSNLVSLARAKSINN